MEKRIRMWLKTFLIIAGLFFFCFLAGRREPGIDYEKEARIRQYEADENVEKMETTLLAYGDMISGEKQDHTDFVLTTDGRYTYQTKEVEALLYKRVTAYVKDDVVLEVLAEQKQEETVLSNVWISEVEAERILCFLSGYSFYLPYQTENDNREQIADILLQDGEIKECCFKKEKITGKLLGITADTVRLPGESLPLAENVKVYRLYGDLEEISLQDLPIGYENTDYVIEDGKICACLVTSEESMETIRVLLQSGNYDGRYHESVSLSADCAYTLQYGTEEETHAAGESICITPDSTYYENSDRVMLTLSVNTGKTEIQSIRRSREKTDYRGSLEIIKTEEGLAVINELLLEEYLYGVVPSEMPTSYPAESLKAQAVCARTYAYRNMEKAGLPELGAHVDDSTAFQVYGNTEEKAEATAAVKATKGQLLLYDGEPIDAYYYSTSCGYGTDVRAWNGIEAEGTPYLCAKTIAVGEAEVPAPEELQEEDAFEQFILAEPSAYYESEEAWYRWQYTVAEIDIAEMEQRLSDRYAVQPGFILTKTGEDDYSSQPVGKIGSLKDIRIIKRNAGGNAAQLLIEGSEGTYLVQTEYNIRYVLHNGQHAVIRRDGTESVSASLLPSAFFMLTAGKEKENVIGYTIIGGGYGHGIGMSQNGAKNMALAGLTEEEILTFFYEGSRIEAVY